MIHNRLLDLLPASDLVRLLPALEDVTLEVGTVVHDVGVHLRDMYFPTTAVFSIIHETDEGAGTEVVMTGAEGVVGISVALGIDVSLSKSVVHVAGAAKRLPVATLRKEVLAGNALLAVLLRYTNAYMAHMAQTAVCNRHHSTEQQVCRYLLLTADRAKSDVLNLTQELIALRLGVRREGVSVAAERLQQKGFIHYTRGKITIVNRGELERCACECVEAINQLYAGWSMPVAEESELRVVRHG